MRNISNIYVGGGVEYLYTEGMETNQIFLPDTRLPGIQFLKYSK